MSIAVSIQGTRASLNLLLPDAGMPQFVTPMGAFTEGPVQSHTARNSRINGMDIDVPAAVLLPTGGMGAFQWPALAGHRDGRHFVLHFGNWQVEQANPQVAVLRAHDLVAEVGLSITIQIFPGDVMVFSSRLENQGTDFYQLDRCMAGSVLLEEERHVATFDGAWGREFHLLDEKLGSALWMKENRRGRTSHDRFPALIACRESALRGPVVGVHLGWSGNHVMAIDRLDDGRRLIHAGELFEPGEMRLAPGAHYASPKLFVHCAASLDAMAASFHDHVRNHVLTWPNAKMPPRPVLLNTWEGNYFAHDLASLKGQADAAAALGVERFVLDDGWFKGRVSEKSGLGDWSVEPAKYPNGLQDLAAHVTGLGMDFGLWFEPEMVNPQSDLFKAHPDWVLQVEGLAPLLSRNQLVLDLSRNEVFESIFAQMRAVLSQVSVNFIKWDMNRDLTAAGGADGRAATSRQTHAVYRLMARIRAQFPHLEIESCASGGGRADYGALAHCHRVWVSDMTDALERQTIQRGASLFLPPEIMGQHVSARPSHQTLRSHSLSFRAITAFNGHFGIELNPLEMPLAEKQELMGWIALFKRLRDLMHGGGDAFVLPERFGQMVYGTVAKNRTQAVVIVAQCTLMMREQPQPLRVPHLEPDATFALTLPAGQTPAWIRPSAAQKALFDGKVGVSGRTLQNVGVALPQLYPESAVLIEITKIPNEASANG